MNHTHTHIYIWIHWILFKRYRDKESSWCCFYQWDLVCRHYSIYHWGDDSWAKRDSFEARSVYIETVKKIHQDEIIPISLNCANKNLAGIFMSSSRAIKHLSAWRREWAFPFAFRSLVMCCLCEHSGSSRTRCSELAAWRGWLNWP